MQERRGEFIDMKVFKSTLSASRCTNEMPLAEKWSLISSIILKSRTKAYADGIQALNRATARMNWCASMVLINAEKAYTPPRVVHRDKATTWARGVGGRNITRNWIPRQVQNCHDPDPGHDRQAASIASESINSRSARNVAAKCYYGGDISRKKKCFRSKAQMGKKRMIGENGSGEVLQEAFMAGLS